jgi:hypothetical protein
MAECPATQLRFAEPSPQPVEEVPPPTRSPRRWYHGTVTKWALLLGIAVVGVTTALVGFSRHGRAGAELVFAELIPAWQTYRANEPMKADSPAARAMLRLARPWPGLATALADLDRSYPDEVPAQVARVNQAARDSAVPYWLDVQTVKGRPVLLSYLIQGRHRWQSAEKTVETLQLRRVDRLNVELGLLGQASANGPLIFLHRIEDDWATQLAETSDLGSPIEAGINALFLGMAYQMSRGDLAELGAALRERRRRFELMQNRMHVVVPRPSGLVWSADWFGSVEPLTKFANGHGPLVFDSDLQAVRQADQALHKPEYRTTLASLVSLRAESVEAHEARHAIDPASPPLPWFLRIYTNPEFAEQINKEMRAYLGELHDAPNGPCLSLIGLARAAFLPKARRTPHFFAGRIIVRTLDPPATAMRGAEDHDGHALGPLDEAFPDAEPVAFLRTQCTAAASSVREKVERLWRTFYGEEMPALARLD